MLIVRGLRKVFTRPAVDGLALSSQDAAAALAFLRGLGREGLLLHPCVGPDRVDFVLPGCAVFAAINQVWPAQQVIVADRGLREGMLLRMIRGDRPRQFRVDGRRRDAYSGK